MDLSVIIVSYNVRDLLRDCLISVRKAVKEISAEVFVIDNNSGDGSGAMVSAEFPEIRITMNNRNAGFSTACNQGIKESSGKFILLLNPDTLVEADCFSKCLRFMNDHPEAGALGVRMTDADGNFLPESKRALPEPLTAFFKVSGLSYVFPRSGIINRYYLPQIGMYEISPSEVISGAFMFIRREALEKAGLPDERFFMYGEDIDLSYRILRAGYKNYYFPEVSIIHYKGRSTSRKNYSDIMHFYSAMRIYARKRQQEKFSLLYWFIIPVIYSREFIGLAIRFLRITFRH